MWGEPLVEVDVDDAVEEVVGDGAGVGVVSVPTAGGVTRTFVHTFVTCGTSL